MGGVAARWVKGGVKGVCEGVPITSSEGPGRKKKHKVVLN